MISTPPGLPPAPGRHGELVAHAQLAPGRGPSSTRRSRARRCVRSGCSPKPVGPLESGGHLAVVGGAARRRGRGHHGTAYGRVEHSDPAHAEMTLHRNLALAAVALLLATRGVDATDRGERDFMLRGSERYQVACRICADICRACAESLTNGCWQPLIVQHPQWRRRPDL